MEVLLSHALHPGTRTWIVAWLILADLLIYLCTSKPRLLLGSANKVPKATAFCNLMRLKRTLQKKADIRPSARDARTHAL